MISSFFVWLSGANTEALKEVPPERKKYIALGGIVLTASVPAFFAGFFAFSTAMHLHFLAALPLGVALCFAIIFTNRGMISSTRQKRWYHNLALAMPRVLLALIIAGAISIPLTLQIFDDAIEPELEVIQQEDQEEFRKNLDWDQRFVGIPELGKRIAELNAIVDTGIDMSAAERDATVVRLQKEVDELEPQVEQARADFIEENSGEGGTGQPGRGPVWLEKKQTFEHLNAALEAKKNELAAARAAVLDRLRSQETQVRAAAVAELPVASAELARLQERKAQEEADFIRASENSDGLLARLTALEHITSVNDTTRTAQLTLLALIAALEILPVFIKFLMTIGPKSPYDLAVESMVDAEIQRLTRVLNQRQRQERAMADRQQAEIDVLEDIYAEETRIRKDPHLLVLYAEDRRLRAGNTTNPEPVVLAVGSRKGPRQPQHTPPQDDGDTGEANQPRTLRTRLIRRSDQPGSNSG